MTEVLNEYKKILNASKTLGLEVNAGKCELFLVNAESDECLNSLQSFNMLTPGVKLLNKENLTLLGAPIFPNAIENSLEPKLQKLILMSQRLKEIDAHDAFFLLGNCFSMPKLTYTIRTSPCFLKSEILNKYDSVIKNCLQDILNISLEEPAGDQATLLIKLGGLGIKLASEVALPAYLSSVYSSNSIVQSLIPESIKQDLNPFL